MKSVSSRRPIPGLARPRQLRRVIPALILMLVTCVASVRAGSIFDDDAIPPKPVDPSRPTPPEPPATGPAVSPAPDTSLPVSAPVQPPAQREIPAKGDLTYSR